MYLLQISPRTSVRELIIKNKISLKIVYKNEMGMEIISNYSKEEFFVNNIKLKKINSVIDFNTPQFNYQLIELRVVDDKIGILRGLKFLSVIPYYIKFLCIQLSCQLKTKLDKLSPKITESSVTTPTNLTTVIYYHFTQGSLTRKKQVSGRSGSAG